MKEKIYYIKIICNKYWPGRLVNFDMAMSMYSVIQHI